ncbi:MAG TPA: PEP-CTERM sorting domain-containing protein [Duganella sp.]
MQRLFHRALSAVVLTATLGASQAALADTFTYEFSWSGKSQFDSTYGESEAKVSATVVVQSNALGWPNMNQISDVSMTVQDASVGNGLFTKNDFSKVNVVYRTIPVLTPNERYELSTGDVYDIAFFSNGSGAPSSFAIHTMWAGNVWGGTALYLSSAFVTRAPDAVSAVPEPATYAMLLAGLGMLGFAARKRGATKNAKF